MLSVFTEHHEWLLGHNFPCTKICLHHKQSTDSIFLLCKYYETEPNEFRVLVSPDNVGLLSNELLSKSELQFSMLTVLPDYCKNELIQTVVQSARDYNPGMILRSVHLDLRLQVSNDVKTFHNKSYEVADISGTVVEKHVIDITEDFLPTILRQCVLLKSSLENFSIDALSFSKYNLTISGAEALCTVLSESTSLKGLFLKDIELNSSEATLICKGLSNNCGLETFEFRSPRGDCSILLLELEKHMTIKNLKIDSCHHIGEGARSLYTLLSRNQSLMKLFLVNIYLSSDEAMLISEGLKNNLTLETVCFHYVKGDLSTLLKGLLNHKTLILLIVINIFHPVEYLLDVMNSAKVLSHVILYDCGLTSTEFQDIISGAVANNLKEIAICDGQLFKHYYLSKDFIQDAVTSRNIKITLGCKHDREKYFSSLSCADRVVIIDQFEC